MIVPTLRLGLGLRFPGPGPSFASTAVAVVLAGPAFQADFTGISSLPSWLSFSRASNAMVTDSTGKLTYAPNNLLLQSNNFGDVAWTKTNATVSSGVADPLGGTSATTITATGANAEVFQGVAVSTPGNYISAIWVRRRTGTGNVSLYTPKTDSTVVLSTTSTWTLFSTNGSIPSANGFCDFVLATSGDAIDVYAPTLSQVTYETTPRSADQVITTGSAYYGPRFDHAWNGSAWVATGLLDEEQRTNLFLGSNDFSNAAQVFNNTSRTASATTSPDGTTNAIKLVESTGNSEHRTYQPCSTGNGTTGILACFAKKAERNWIGIRNVAAGIVANFNLNTGVVGTSANCTPLIINYSNGWYLCIIIGTIFDYHIINIGDADTGTASSYAYSGDGTSGVYLYGGTIQQGGFWTSYIPTTTAAVTRSADILSSSSPLTGYLVAGPSVWEFQDEATGTISRTAYAAGAFDWPVNKWYRSMGVYSAGTDTSSHMTVGSAY